MVLIQDSSVAPMQDSSVAPTQDSSVAKLLEFLLCLVWCMETVAVVPHTSYTVNTRSRISLCCCVCFIDSLDEEVW